MRKYSLFILAGIILGVVMSRVLTLSSAQENTTQYNPRIQRKVVREAAKVREQAAVPARLRIPSLNIDAQVESVGMDEEGRMDVPQNADNTAWFNMGYRPGTSGNAVIAGHLDKETGEPAVFFELNTLEAGDRIWVVDATGKERQFKVIGKEEYPYDSFPMQKVFGTSNRSKLNLITCTGDWNTDVSTYSNRLVIFSEELL